MLDLHITGKQHPEQWDKVADVVTYPSRDKFVCPRCGKEYIFRINLKNHQHHCENVSNRTCNICGKELQTVGGLKQHLNTHHDEKYLCDICGAKFRHKVQIKIHERKHSGERPYSCEVCGKTFAYLINFTNHRSVHTGIRQYWCDPCNSSFSCAGNLLKHNKTSAHLAKVNVIGIVLTTNTSSHIEYTSLRSKWKRKMDPAPDLTSSCDPVQQAAPQEQLSDQTVSFPIAHDENKIYDSGDDQNNACLSKALYFSAAMTGSNAQLEPLAVSNDHEENSVKENENENTLQGSTAPVYSTQESSQSERNNVEEVPSAHISDEPERVEYERSQLTDNKSLEPAQADESHSTLEVRPCRANVEESQQVSEFQPVLHSTFCCFMCGNKFSEKKNLVDHMRNSHHQDFNINENSEKNNECENRGPGDVEDETSDDRNMVVNKCKICGQCIKERGHLLRHMRRVHGGEGLKELKRREMNCRFCSKTYSNELSLMRHEARHPNGTAAIQCAKCGAVFENSKVLKGHKKQQSVQLSCEICLKLFPNKKCLAFHMQISHDMMQSQEQSKVTEFVSSEENENKQNSDDGLYIQLPLQCGSDTGSVKERSQCRYCSKNYSNQKRLLRHEMSHPYGTAAIKCHFCDEVLPNYQVLKSHKKQTKEGERCNVCNRIFPNTSCLSCHTRNSHSTFEDESSCDEGITEINADATVNDDDDDEEDEDNCDNSNDNSLNIEGRLTLEIDSSPKYSLCDTGERPPVLIRIKRERINEEVGRSSTISYVNNNDDEGENSYSTSHSFSPPHTVEEQGSVSATVESDDDNNNNNNGSDEDEEEEVDEEYTDDHKEESQELQSSDDNEEQDNGLVLPHSNNYQAGEGKFTPSLGDDSQSASFESNNEDSDEDYRPPSPSRHIREEDSSYEGSDDCDSGLPAMKKKASRRKSRRRNQSDLTDESVSEDSADDESVDMHFSRYVSNNTVCEESDDDPDWQKTWSSPGSTKKKVSRGRGRGKGKKLKFEFPTRYVEQIKRPRVRGCGGQKALDAAAALAEAVQEMESSTPELKVVICPLRRSVGGVIMKATVKRYNQILVDDSDYLVDDKKDKSSEVDLPDSGKLPSPEQDRGNAISDPINAEQEEEYILDKCQENVANEGTQNIPEQEMDPGKLDVSYSCDTENSFMSSVSDEEVENSVTFKTELIDSEEEDVSLDSICSADDSLPTDSCSSVKDPINDYDLTSSEGINSSKEIRYICKICGRELQYRSHLLRHLRRVHGGEGVDDVMRRLMKCRFCSKQYSNELSLVHHEKLHDGTNKIKCSKCNESFDDKNALRRHQRKVHWEHQPVCCEICKKQLADSTCLKAHMKHMHTAEERKATVFTCEVCGRQLHTKTAFQNHVASKCGTNLLFPCETCGKSFSFKGSLKAHQLLHSGVRSFLCRFCGKSFHQKGEMKRHERKHTGEKPFVCNECGRAFAYRESLLGHSAVHTGIKPFPCKNCGMRFSCSGNLVKHRRSNNCKVLQQSSPVSTINPLSPANLMNPENTVISENDVDVTNSVHSQKSVTVLNTLNPTATVTSVCSESLVNPVQNVVKSSDSGNTTENISRVEPSIISSNLANSLLIAGSHDGVVKGTVPTVTNVSEQERSNPAELDYRLSTHIMTSVIKSTPPFGIKSTGVSLSLSKHLKSVSHTDFSQTSVGNATANRLSSHGNPMIESQDSNTSTHSSYSTQSHSSTYGNNHYGNNYQRQINQSSSSDRHFAQFSTDARVGRTEPLLDHQIAARRDMNRQMMDVVDRQASRLLDCFTGVQLSNHTDSRTSIQSFPAVVHPSSYSNIHAGPFNYTAAHSGNHGNMYVTSPLIGNQVNFSGFHPGNHITINQSNQLPVHSSAHPGYPVTHMGTLGALFGHLGQPKIHPSSFPSNQYTAIHGIGQPASSPPPGNN